MGTDVPEAVVGLMAIVADSSRPAIERLRTADALRDTLDAWLPRLAEEARVEEGQSWATIGSALQISRQAAQQRFGVPRRQQAARSSTTGTGHEASFPARRQG